MVDFLLGIYLTITIVIATAIASNVAVNNGRIFRKKYSTLLYIFPFSIPLIIISIYLIKIIESFLDWIAD